MAAQRGGAAAIRGFRLQTFYILRRLLDGGSDLFQPEGDEDLLRLAPDGTPVEHVQVKTYGNDLTISVLESPSGAGTLAEPPYFRRVLKRLQSGDAQETLVIIGTLGPQMRKAWQGNPAEQQKVRGSLNKKGYSDTEVDLLFQRLQLVEVDEAEQGREIAEFLQEGITAGDVRTARAVLAWWLLELSEQPKGGRQNIVSTNDVQARLQAIGRYTHELRAYHEEWNRTLQPLLPDDLRMHDPEVLRQELFEGVGARLEHILAGVDVIRSQQLEAIEEGFKQRPLVVVRGASGQGKTALAYRYLHDAELLPLSYRLGRLRDVTQAQNVLQALQAFLRKHTGAPLYLLVDVAPGDREWLEVLINTRGMNGLRMLVTILQEDWTRSQEELELLSPANLHLKFEEEEAAPVFAGLQQVRPSEQFLSFSEAWNAFNQEGPLLEFVYMVTHEGHQLRARLAQQLKLLRDEWRDRPVYESFLHAAAFAAAANAAVEAKKLARHFGINNVELAAIVRRLNEEHLLREQGGTIRGLHAIRSELLLDLMSDPDFNPSSTAFADVLGSVDERDLELLALNALFKLAAPETEVLPYLQALRPNTWQGRVGVARSLIWWSIRTYTMQAKNTIEAAFNEYEFGWSIYVSPDVMELRSRGLAPALPDWSELKFLGPSWVKKAKHYRQDFAQYTPDFSLVSKWLAEQRETAAAPRETSDWLAAAELGFYSSLWPTPLEPFLALDLQTMTALPLLEAAEVYYGLYFVPDAGLRESLQGVHESLVERFKREGHVKLLDDDGQRVGIHFIVPVEDSLLPAQGENAAFAGTMVRLDILHYLFPDREIFGSQGYGHQNNLLQVTHRVDDTHKELKREMLPPSWGTQWNATFRRLAELEFLLSDWQAHANYEFENRQWVVGEIRALVDALPKTSDGLKHWFKGKQVKQSAVVHTLHAHALKRRHHDRLPRSAVDPWGLAVTNRASLRRGGAETRAVRKLSAQLKADHHDAYFKALRDYNGSLNTFFRQAFEGTYALSMLHTSRNEEVRFRRENDGLLRSVRLSTVNLSETLDRLPAMQRTFRERFGHLFEEAKLTKLEEEEQEVFDALWKVWPDVARVPALQRHGPPEKTAADVLSDYHQRLENELQRLRDSGLQVSLLATEAQWQDQPTLWLTIELDSAEDLLHAHEELIQCLTQVVKRASTIGWKLDILAQEWAHTVIIPTRKGKVLPRLTWVHSLVMLCFPDNYFWRHQPTPVSEDQLQKLGLRCWQITFDPWLINVFQKLTEATYTAMRLENLQGLLQIEELPVDIRRELEEEIRVSHDEQGAQVYSALDAGLHLKENKVDEAIVASALNPTSTDHVFNSEFAIQQFGQSLEPHQIRFASLLMLMGRLDQYFLSVYERKIQEADDTPVAGVTNLKSS